MSDLTVKSRATLEFHKILQMLADFAVSEEAKERCLQLRPTDRLDQAEEWQAHCVAARRMMEKRGAPPLSGLKPVGAALSRLGLGGTLNSRELLDIGGTLRAARACKSYHSAEGQVTRLDGFFRLLTGNKYLEDHIHSVIISEDEISDNASTKLADIRRLMRSTAAKARDMLNKYIGSPTYAKVLQESLITQRGGRFVIPVKAEHKNAVPGLVHDVSASGATLYIEPMPVVQAGNELRELEGKEKKEIERILAELSAECDAHSETIRNDYDVLVSLDVIFAKARLASDMHAAPPRLNDGGYIHFRKARHPLLDRQTAVPIDIWLGKSFRTLIITGPNTGGKTVTLKTTGLLTLMASCGLQLPTGEDSDAFVTSRVYADIGDEQSIAQSLSTFSSHMTNIVGILAETEPGCLVLFDELGAGTDPVEGAALAVAIIEEAGRGGALIAATTHYAELKSYAITHPGVENASCEFSVETLRPTYRLLIGIPGKSNAFAISARLGLGAHIIEAASARIGTESAAFEDVLAKLDKERQAMEAEREAAFVLRREAQEDRTKAAAYRAAIEKEHQKAAESARAEARSVIMEARQNADEILRELNAMKQSGITNEQMTALRQKLNEADQKAAEQAGLPSLPPEEGFKSPPKAGDEVILIATGGRAVVMEPPDKNGNLLLQAGILKVTVNLDGLRPMKNDKPKKKKPQGGVSLSRSPEPVKMELDIRGQMADEGVMEMENYIDSASLRHVETVTIIHGKGTGALRTAVHTALRRNKSVKSFRPGRYGEGENGETVVELK